MKNQARNLHDKTSNVPQEAMRSVPSQQTPPHKNHEIWLLALFVLALPFIYTSGPLGVRIGKMLAFVLVGGLVGALVFARQLRPSLGLLYGAAVLSALKAGFGPVHATALYFVTAGAFFSVYAGRFAFTHVRPFFNLLLVAGLLQAVYGYSQICGYDPLFERVETSDMWLPVGTLGQQTLYGPFIVASLCVALYMKPIALIVLVPAALATLSSMTYLSLLAVFALFTLANWRMRGLAIFTGVGLLVGMAGFLYKPDFFIFDAQGRLAVWKGLLDLWSRQFWFGWGLGSYQVIAPVELPRAVVAKHGLFLQAHNEYLQVLFEMGLVGGLATLYVIYDFCKGAGRVFHYKEGKVLVSMFCALAVNALGSFPLHTAPLAILLILSWTWVVNAKMVHSNDTFSQG